MSYTELVNKINRRSENMPTIESLGLDRLTRDERMALAHDLWASVLPKGPPLLSEAQMRELERRADEDDADPDDFIPWEQVKAETHARMHP